MHFETVSFPITEILSRVARQTPTKTPLSFVHGLRFANSDLAPFQDHGLSPLWALKPHAWRIFCVWSALLDLVSQTPRPRGRCRPLFADYWHTRDWTVSRDRCSITPVALCFRVLQALAARPRLAPPKEGPLAVKGLCKGRGIASIRVSSGHRAVGGISVDMWPLP